MKDRVSLFGALLRFIGNQRERLFKLHKDRVIFTAFALSCIFLIVSYIYPCLALREIKLPEVRQEKAAGIKITPEAEARPLEFYLGNIRAGSMFSRSQGTREAAASVNVDLTKNMDLVGIISGESPQAVIQDNETEKVYYLNKGQFMGEFQVEDIQEGKVILSYKGQRIELHL